MEGRRIWLRTGSAALLLNDFQIVYNKILGVGTGDFPRPQDIAVRPANPVVIDRKKYIHRLSASAIWEISCWLVPARASGNDIGLTVS